MSDIASLILSIVAENCAVYMINDRERAKQQINALLSGDIEAKQAVIDQLNKSRLPEHRVTLPPNLTHQPEARDE